MSGNEAVATASLGSIDLNTSVSSLDATANGSITVVEASDMTLVANSTNGSVDVDAAGILTVGTGNVVAEVDVTLEGTNLTLTGATTATTGNVSLTATTGNIAGTGLVSGNVAVATASLGSIALNTSVSSLDATANGTITVVEASDMTLVANSTNGSIDVDAVGILTVGSGNVVAEVDVTLEGSNLTLTGATTATTGNVSLTATTGNISGTGLVSGNVAVATASLGSISLQLDVNSASASGKNDVTLNQAVASAVNFTTVTSQTGNVSLTTAGTTAGNGMTLGTLTAGSNANNVTLTGGVEFTLSTATAGNVTTSVPTGTVVLSNAELLVSRSPATYIPPLNTVFTLIDSPQTISGFFTGYANGTSINVDGIFLTVNYTTDVTLTATVGDSIYVYSGWKDTLSGSTVTLPGSSATAVLGYNAFATIIAATTQAGVAIGTNAVYVYAGATAVDAGIYAESVTVDSSITYTFEMGANRLSDATNATMAATTGPALTLSGSPGDVSITGGFFGTSVNSSTLLMSAGNLTLRGATVTETFSGDQSGLSMTGGTADLGNGTSAGNNTFVTQGVGRLISLADSATSNVSALGNAFTIDGTPYTQPLNQTAGFGIENAVFHKMDTGNFNAGLVTWTSNNVYVTTSTAGVQRGVDVSGPSGWTVNVNAGTYNENVTIAKAVTIAGPTGATLAADKSITLESTANLGQTNTTLPFTATTVNVNSGAKLSNGLALILANNPDARVNWADMFVNPSSTGTEGQDYNLTIREMDADSKALYAPANADLAWGPTDGGTEHGYSGSNTTVTFLYTDNGNYNGATPWPGATTAYPDLTATIRTSFVNGDRNQLVGTLSRTISNVAPTANLNRQGSGDVTYGSPVTVSLTNRTDPSTVDIAAGFRYQYFVNSVQYQPANSLTVTLNGQQESVTSSASLSLPGSLFNGGATNTVIAKIWDKDGGNSSTNTVSFFVTDAPVAPFGVSTAISNASGVDIVFSKAIDPASLVIWAASLDTESYVDVTLVGQNTGAVRGSVAWNSVTNTVSFVKTGTVLAADTYTLTVKGGALGILSSTGETLASNYVTQFTVAAPAATVISVGDFARAAGQPINLDPAVPASGGLLPGLPVKLSSVTDLQSADFVLRYDPALMQVNSVALPAGLVAANWVLGASNIDNVTGSVSVSLYMNPTTGTAITGTDVSILSITASVPTTTSYDRNQILRFEGVNLYALGSDPIAATSDRAVHKARLLADANGDAIYDAGDASLINFVVVGLNRGFISSPWVDPIIVADVVRSGSLNAQDAYNAAAASVLPANQWAANIPLMPALPANPLPSPTAGLDPLVSIPTGLTGSPGQTVNAPVSLYVEPGATVTGATYTVAYDATKLSLGTVGLGSGLVASDWTVITSGGDGTGSVTVSVYFTGGAGATQTSIPASATTQITTLPFTVLAGATAGSTALDVQLVNGSGQSTENQQGLVWTQSDGSIDIVTDPPEVTGVYVYSSSWTNTFKDFLGTSGAGTADLGYEIPTSATDPEQLKSIPWTNVNTIRVTFDEDVNITAVDLKITGVNTATYSGDFSYGQVGGVWTATWSLPGTGVFTADKIMVNVSGDVVSKASGIKLAGAWTNPTTGGGSVMPSGGVAKTPGQPFNFRVNMLPGAVSGGPKVIQSDLLAVRQGLNAEPGNPKYTVFRDLSGTGKVTQIDLLAVRQRLNVALPAGDPQAYTFEPAPMGGSMMVTSASSSDGSTTLSDAQRLAWASLGSDFVEGDGSLKKKTT